MLVDLEYGSTQEARREKSTAILTSIKPHRDFHVLLSQHRMRSPGRPLNVIDTDYVVSEALHH